MIEKRTSLLPLQQAMYDRLRSTLSCAVYDDVPDNPQYPYVVIGEDTSGDWSTKLVSGEEVTSTNHVYSRYRGSKEVKRILDEMVQSVTKSPLTLEGFKVVTTEVEFLQVYKESREIRHGVVRFRLKIIVK